MREAEVIVSPAAITLGSLSTGVNGYYGTGSGSTRRADLRPMGVTLEPAGVVAVAAVDSAVTCSTVCSPLCQTICTPRARIQAHILDVATPAVTTSFLTAWAGPVVSFTSFTSVYGMAATSFRDSSSNLDGLFLFTQTGSPAAIRAMTFEGEAATTPPVTVAVSGIHSSLIASVVPGVDHGTWDATSKTFMAYTTPNPTSGAPPLIRVGFLTRSGTAWTFTQTDQILATGGVGGQVYDNIQVAYDANNHEFTVGWVFDETNHPDLRDWTAYLQRFTWAGVDVGPRFDAHHYVSDPLHSGSQLAFNRDTNRYHFLFQHNSAMVSRTPTGLTCTRSATNCDAYQYCVNPYGRTSTEVDYYAGWEFRQGGPCGSSADGCTPGAGIIGELDDNSLPTTLCGSAVVANQWRHESFGGSNQLWPAGSPGELTDIVRAPDRGRSVALFVQTPPSATPSWGFRTVDEPTSREFDE